MWKDIPQFERRYEVSDDGYIRNKNTLHILKAKVDKDGYHQIGLRQLGQRAKQWFSIHRLVAMCFIGNPNDINLQVDHIDHNKTNNTVNNLRWISQQYNNLNRNLTVWKTNITTGELYITRYKNGFMIRINRSDFKRRVWCHDIESAICKRNMFINEIKKIHN